MLGERLRQARLAAGLTLEGLAKKLERPITRQALSKYETGASEPPPSRITEIAAALNIPISSLLSKPATEIQWLAFRKLAKLSKSRQERITAVAGQRLEGEVRLREMFQRGERHNLPSPFEVQTLEDCDHVAAAVRMRWSLGFRPVNSLVELTEEHGVAVVAWPEEWGFDGLSGWANRTPFIVLNKAVPPDRLRLNVAHELGHLVMKSTGDARRDEQFAFRFAASFLVPAESARYELGFHRRNIAPYELGLLKKRWGLSMQGWIRRAKDLEIISDGHYKAMNISFRQEGWHKKEPFEYEATESPTLFSRLLSRALAEKVIAADDVIRFDPGFVFPDGQAGLAQVSLRSIAQRPPEERHYVLEEMASALSQTEIDTRVPASHITSD